MKSRVKRWECCECGKRYCFVVWCIKHRKKAHEDRPIKFRDLSNGWINK